MIYDIFETENFASYSGSYNSRIMYGSFFSNLATGYVSGGVVGSSGSRVYIADKTIGIISSSFYDNKNLYLSSHALNIVSGTYIGHNVRFLTLTCDKETYVDSCMINPLYYHVVNGGYPVIDLLPWSGSNNFNVPDIPSTGSAAIFFGFVSGSPGFTATGSSVIYTDFKWPFRFPFMSLYKNLMRTFQISYNAPYSLSSSFVWGAGYDINAITGNLSTNRLGLVVSIIPKDIGTLDYIAYVYDMPYISGVINSFPSRDMLSQPTLTDLYKSYFGSSDNRYKIVDKGYRVTNIITPWKYYIAPILRGWKYGVYNGNQVKTTAIFRSNHYGQFRDMLEQRPYSNFFDEEEKKVLGSVVVVTPVSGTILYNNMLDYVTATNPSYNPRDSGIWDYSYRSGQPYFDL